MQPHQLAWLMCHPHRTVEWLKQRSKDGFDIHHLDGDPLNNAPDNLVLIETTDHICVIHGFSRQLARVPKSECGGRKKSKPRKTRAREELRAMRERATESRSAEARKQRLSKGRAIAALLAE